LQRQQEEQHAQEQELLQLQVLLYMPIRNPNFSHNCQAAIDALQARLDKKTRDADNGTRLLASCFEVNVCLFDYV
jgi:hypothetical protein